MKWKGWFKRRMEKKEVEMEYFYRRKWRKKWVKKSPPSRKKKPPPQRKKEKGKSESKSLLLKERKRSLHELNCTCCKRRMISKAKMKKFIKKKRKECESKSLSGKKMNEKLKSWKGWKIQVVLVLEDCW